MLANKQLIHADVYSSVMKVLYESSDVIPIAFGGQPAGIGKRTLMRQIAARLTKDINCLDLLDNITLSVNTLRSAVDWTSLCPFSGFKVLLLSGDSVSGNGFNVLLRLFEESPSYLRILFSYGDRGRIPITVLSRCFHFYVPPMTEEQVIDCLVAKGMLRHKAMQLAVASEGSVTVAEQLLNLEGSSAVVIGGLKYLIGRQTELFLSMSRKWQVEEIKFLELVMLFAKRWQYRPFPMVIVPVELVVTLAKLKIEDIDRVLDVLRSGARSSLKIFAFAELVSIGRKERF